MPERIAQRFEPLALLSESPIAQEFRARDLREGGEVALKLIRPETCRRSPENFFRYRRLLRECAPIRHPNLSAIVDTGEWNGGEYVAFEWTDALRFCDRTDRATVDEAIEIMRAVCHGLEAAHSRGVLHGLLNAESVLLALDLERVAQIRDFGIGLLLDLTRIREKADVRRIFRYLAPEQSGILRKPADGRSDLYSMGILFYELLAGAPPYESDEVNVLVSQHVSRAPQSLRERNEDTPRVLEQIVFKLIAKDPDDRYQTVGGVLADLDALAQRRLEGRGGEFEIGLQDKLRKPSFSTRLIGREAELNRLRTALQLTRGSGSSVVFIHGEPGIGKTRLINELRAEVHGMGGLFIGGKCSQYDAGSPFKVLSMAIESYVERVRRLDVEEQDRHRARIREGVGELGREIMKLTPRVEELIGKAPALAELEPDQQRTRFLVTVVNFLAGLGAPGQPLVIFLEDLQWSEEGSCELIERLAHKLQSQHVMLIISYRDNEVDATHPVSRLRESLSRKERAFEDLAIRPFGLEQAVEMVGRVLLESPDRVTKLAEYLRGRTQGNPFFILELLRTMFEEGVVRYENGKCRFDPAELERVHLPDNIVEAVLRRIRDLPQADLQVLSFASVIGKQVELELLSTLTGREIEELVASIDRAIEQQILARDMAEEQSVSFVHDRVREAFYSRAQDVGALHRQIAEALEREHPDAAGPIVYDLAYHFTQGDVRRKARDYSLKAAAMAAQSSAHDLAVDLYQKARKMFEEDGETRDPRYIELLEQLGESHRLAGRFKPAIEILQACSELVPSSDAVRHARVLAKLADAHFENSDTTMAADLIERALAAVGISFPRKRTAVLIHTVWQFTRHLWHMARPKWLVRRLPPMNEREAVIARLVSRLGYLLYFNDIERTFYTFLWVVNECETRAPSRMLAGQYALGGPIWLSVPWYWKAMRDLTTCLDLARQLGDPLQEARAYTYLSWTQLMMCRPREALEFSTKAIRMLRRLGEYYDLGASLVFRDQANCVITPCKQAIEENRTFLSLAADAHIHQPMSWGQIHGAYLKALQGDFTDETVRSVEEALRICERNNDRPSNLLAHGVLAFGYLRRKDYTRAVAAAEHVLSILGTHEMKACWIKQVWPICAQVYLEALQHGGDANPETRSHLLKRARYFCEEALKRGRHYGYIFGWACQVFGTYWMLRGDAPKARRYWDRGIRFHRENESPFRLACLLKESGRWGLKARSDDRQALERLVEAKDVFTRYDYFNDAAETAALIRGSGASEPAESPRSALTFKRHLESLLSVTQAIGSVFEIEGLLEHILSYAMEVTGAERGCILLNSESSGRLELRTRRGWSAETSAKPFSYEGYGVSLSLVESVRKKQTARVAGTKDDDDVGAELGQYGVRQAMAVPLRTKEKDLGLLYLDNHLADGVFGDDELELMKSFAIQAAVSIENTHLVQSLVEQDRLKQEMKLGQEIQRGFLPKEAPNVRGLKVSAFMQPAREIGGDYYDYIVRPGDNGSSPLAIVIGDVTGKGLGAGLNMAMVKTTLLTLSREPIGVREILIKANRILHGQMSFGTFISLLYLQWDPAARAMTFAGAGHCDLLAVRAASGKVETVRSGGAALGLIPEIEQKVQERELPLAPGDKLVLYTDGVVEAQNAAEEEFGAARLISALEKNARLGPEELLAAVRAELRAFAGDAAQYDDITLIALELDE